MSRLTAATTSGVASGPASNKAGSPGTMCSSRNTATEARIRTGIDWRSRRITYVLTRSPLHHLPVQPCSLQKQGILLAPGHVSDVGAGGPHALLRRDRD